MLLGYGAKNCWCFKEWLDIDFRFNGYVPEEISLGKDYSLVLGFEGANASGKTNALKVLAFITDFMQNSFMYSLDSEIFFDTFFFNNYDAEFYLEFRTSDDTEYRYETTLQRSHVCKEILTKIDKQSEKIIFQRDENSITVNLLYDNDTKVIFRKNVSFVSTLHQYEIKAIEPIYTFLSDIVINVTYKGLVYPVNRNISSVSKLYLRDPSALEFTKGLIKKFDTGIDNISIKYRKDEKNIRTYFPIFHHVASERFKPLGIDSESTGTQLLYINLLRYYRSLNSGGILVLDEFDINLHHDILPYLIKLFTNPDTNPKSAQMIFTSLNPDVMDMLGKYRVYLFEKENGESFGYRLDEPKTNILRNDRSVSAPYRKHLLGGYPKIEA